MDVKRARSPMQPFGVLALGLVLLVGCAAVPARVSLVDQVERSRSPSEHLALAQEYDLLASRARTEIESHRALLDAYSESTEYRWVDRVGTPTGMRAMPRHCEQLIRIHEEVARIYSQMADEHRQWARLLSDAAPE